MIAMMRHNFGMKLLALAIAIAAWSFTRLTDPIEERQMVMAVDVRLSEGMSLVSRYPMEPTVSAYVTGPSSRLERLQNSNPRVVLDARGLPPLDSELIEPRLDRRFAGVSVEFAPPSFEITVDRTARTEFVPEEIADGHLPSGYFIDSRSGLPPVVVVQGANSLVERVNKVIYHLNLSALTGSIELHVDFIPVDEQGNEIRNLELNPIGADIAIGLQPSQALKAVPIVVDVQGNPATGYALTSLSSDPFLVDVAGPAESLTAITSVHTAPVNLTGKTSSFEQSVALISPSEQVSLSVSRATVQVEIAQIDTTRTFENLLIELRGTDPAYTYTLVPERVDVTVRGGIERLAEVTSDLIRPRVDLADLGPGLTSVRVSVALPSGVQSDSISPSSITVTIIERVETPEEDQEENPVDIPAEDDIEPSE